MEILTNLANLFLHLDKNLAAVIAQYGMLTYLLLFIIIFMETGFVVTPFLPGDSLLFIAGTFAASNTLDINVLFGSLAFAAVAGDTANYWIGHYSGPRVFKENSRFFKKEHLDRTHRFYEKHGGKTIIIARFIPIIRTFAPFVAGVGKMTYGHFIAYNIIGGLAWVAIFVLGGYFFGNLPIVKNNFQLVVVAIILISILPAMIEYMKHKRNNFARTESPLLQKKME